MGKQIPSAQEWEAEYKAGVTAKAGKWQRRTLAATGVAEAAKSEAAESAYQSAMQQVLSNRQRQKGLRDVTDADIKAGVQAVGASGYSSQASAKSAKAARKFEPYRAELQAAVDGLPPRTADATQNIMNRVVPIATRLQNRKRQG